MWQLSVRPRRWQEEALQLWMATKRGVIAVVTGGGKTTFAQLCMRAFEEENPLATYAIVVPTTALLDQWYVSLREDLGVSEGEIACFSGQERSDEFRKVNLLVLNTAREIAPILAEQRSSCFLIVDECHRAGSETNARALRGAYSATLGLSATPERDYDQGFEENVVPALGPVLFRYGYVQAREDDVITPFDLVNVQVDLLSSERAEYDRLTRRLATVIKRVERGEVARSTLVRLLQKRAAVSAAAALRVPVAASLVDQHRGARTLVFHERVESAEAIHRVLNARGHSAAIYHSQVGPHLRRSNLQMYRRGLYDVLVSCRALDEGMNVPETTVAVIASSTASSRQRVQRLGRVLRPAQGKERSLIYTVLATEPERRRLEAEANELAGISSVQWLQGRIQNDG